jgi:hypothetical protein
LVYRHSHPKHFIHQQHHLHLGATQYPLDWVFQTTRLLKKELYFYKGLFMAIIFGGDTGLRDDAFGNFVTGITSQFNRFKDGLKQLTSLERIAGVDIIPSAPKENVYVDTGFQNVPGTAFSGSGNISSIDDVKKRRITTQTPHVTVYIKKRLFWSLRNEHDTRFMDPGEKLFMRASKIMFERKCSQIAAYEALTKLERLIEEESELDYQRVEALIDIIENFRNDAINTLEEDAEQAINANPGDALLISGVTSDLNNLKSSLDSIDETVELLKSIANQARKTKQAVHTTWTVDPDNNSDVVNTGRGSGVIELTLIDSIRTSLGIEGNLGSFSFSAQDPYNLMSITNDDVEIALNSAFVENRDIVAASQQGATDQDIGSIFRGPADILEEARRKDEELKNARNTRFLNTTTSLTGSELGEITFEVNPGSASANKVAGRISTSPEPFNSNNFNIVFSQLPPIEQLTIEENRLVAEIFKLLDDYITEVDRISQVKAEGEQDESKKYARRQLRLYYLGKPIIQPMDGVHIYVRGNTATDSEIIGPLNAFLNGSPFLKSFQSGAAVDGATDAVLQEEMRQFNIDEKIVPLEFYRTIRTGSLLRNAGIHVFGGLVSTVGESYDRGAYTLSVSGESNLKWLKLSRANTTPSLEQIDQVLEDPLTPFDLNVDPATGLINGVPVLNEENKRRLGAGKLFFNDGSRKGEPAAENNLGQDIVIRNDIAHTRRKHAPGLVYKWKQGIISATATSNLRTSLSGDDSNLISKLRRDVGVNVVKDPFSNLDIVDAISLMVTGFPHNLEAFILNSRTIGTFTPGNANSPESFFHSFFDITRSTNKALGNFQPFKPNDVTSEQMSKRLNKKIHLNEENNKIQQLESKIARLNDQINNASTESGVANTLTPQLLDAEGELRTARDAFTKSIGEGRDLGLRVYADNIIIDSRDTAESDSASVSKTNNDTKLRSKLLQLRTQIDTKFNTDTNLFIVSDEYDKDLDLQAFAIDLASGEIPLWKSDYKEPYEICKKAAQVMDLEFFCDTQGHIKLQPPKYNKIPLSLLVKMLLLSENKNIDIISPFVKSLFTSRQEALKNKKEILQIEIEINNLFLFGVPGGTAIVDRSVEPGIFLSTGDLRQLPATTSVVSEIQSRKNELFDKIGTQQISDDSPELENIEKEFNELNNPSTPNVNTRRLSISNKTLQLSSQLKATSETLAKIGDPATQEKLFNGIVRQAGVGFGTNLNTGQMASILEPFGDLIEDDFNDFLGPGSSKRFVIMDDQIINYDFKESDQNVHCRVDVLGQLDVLGEQPGQIGNIPHIWAGATDFDLWKQYGWRVLQTQPKPFFKNANTQCAPYALMLLTRQRRDTVRASVTVTGNEYYQLGDVVYINARDMLYYVYGVSHNFSYSGGFKTTLDLRYGHPVGEFIPTPLDVIGKNLIKNQRKFNTTYMARTTASTDIGRCVGTVIFRNADAKTSVQLRPEMLNGDIGSLNLLELKNALIRINALKERDEFDKIEIRGYALSDEEDERRKILARMFTVKEWLTNPISGFSSDGKEIKLKAPDFRAIESKIIRDFDFDNKIDPVILVTDPETGRLTKVENEGRTPSEEVYNVSPDPTQDISAIEIRIEFKKEEE